MFTINGNLVINGQAGTGGWDHPKSADVTAQLKPGADNTFRVEVHNTTPGPAALLAKLIVTTAGGKTRTLVTDGTWKTLKDPGANWHNRAARHARTGRRPRCSATTAWPRGAG